MDADKILMVARSLRTCADCEEDKCRPGCTEPETDYDVGTLAEIIEQQQSDLTTAHARIAELEAEVKRLEFMLDSAKNVAINRGRVVDRLQSHDKEAMELLEAAIKDLYHGCHTCKTANEATKSVTCKCVLSHNWKWQHSDRYEALKVLKALKAQEVQQ